MSWEEIPRVGTEELRRMLERGDPVNLLDIRPDMERAEWFIPGSIHRDVYQALKSGDVTAMEGFAITPGTPVITVCAHGRTSLIAAHLLRQRGIDAQSLEGGMQG